jgi:hypothetical protein
VKTEWVFGGPALPLTFGSLPRLVHFAATRLPIVAPLGLEMAVLGDGHNTWSDLLSGFDRLTFSLNKQLCPYLSDIGKLEISLFQ